MKNVGEGAVESIVAARERGRSDVPARSPRSTTCAAGSTRSAVNKRVLESLIKVNALASLGTHGGAARPAGLGAGIRGARHHRDVAAGQSTLFDLFAVPMAAMAVGRRRTTRWRSRRAGDEIPRSERLRWEKELLGLYLTEHPLGDIADLLPELRDRLHRATWPRSATRPRSRWAGSSRAPAG